MNLLKTFLLLLDLWAPAFCKQQAYLRARELAIASICGFGSKTIASLAIYLGRDAKLPSADYKLFSCSKWPVNDLFNQLLKKALEIFKDKNIVIAVDDTKIRKTGKKIPFAGWNKDPLGPKFQVNLVWAIRYLQMSLLIPVYLRQDEGSCRSVPIRFIPAPYVKKPKKGAPEKEREAYLKAKMKNNLSVLFVNHIKELRVVLDQMGYDGKQLIVVVDGSFCNSTCMNIKDPRISIIARCKKNTVLCHRASSSRKFYDTKKFSPEAIRQDATIVWQTVRVFYGGCWRDMRCKEVCNIFWEGGTKKKIMRTIIMAPIPYVRGGVRNYRDPAYLLTDNLSLPLTDIVQHYLDRWQIEYNHRDEKSILGVGQARVRNEKSVSKQPGLHVAAYSALLLANLIAYEDRHHSDFGEIPGWRKKAKRNTTRALVGVMRGAIIENPEKLVDLNLTVPMISVLLRKVA